MSKFPDGFNITEHECRLGDDLSNCPIDFKCYYSGLGWILFWIGMSARPSKVEFICRRCEDVLQTTTDPKILMKYVGR